MAMNAGFDILINEGRIYNGIKDWKNKTAGSTVHSVQRNRGGTVKPKSCNGNITQTVGLRRNWWVVANPYTGETAGHPAPMPYSLASDHITTWTDCGEMVLDPFM